jgi:hypothetical protein
MCYINKSLGESLMNKNLRPCEDNPQYGETIVWTKVPMAVSTVNRFANPQADPPPPPI